MLTAPYATADGGGVLVGAIFAVAMAAVASGAKGVFQRRGIFTLPKATGEAWTEGQKVYWDNTNRRLTTTASANTLVGAAAQAQLAGDTSGKALLTGQIV